MFRRVPVLLLSVAAIAAVSLLPEPPSTAFGSARRAGPAADSPRRTSAALAPGASPISFAHPTVAGINGDGFELDLRADPTTPSTMYSAAPGASSANTSWIWKTTNSGKTWKWVPQALPYNGKVQGTTPHCLGGGDTEIAVDPNHHLYFNDLSGAGGVPLQFSTGRSDDGGTTFVCDTAGVPDAGVDRQWYAIIGDPTLNGGDQVDQNTLYLTNDIIGNGQGGCGVGGNVLVMYRSPIPTLAGVPTPNPDAGRTFGPHFIISCDEGIMGNDEVSPIPTKRAENGTLTLATAVRHIFVAHDNSALNKIFMSRCFPVPFGPATANTSDPSGLRCVDKLVANLTGTTGANFPTTAIDAAGNLYAVWEETAGGSQTLLRFSYSQDEGESWSTPISLPTNAPSNLVGGMQLGGPLNSNVFGWPVAGDDGRVDVVWYGTNATGATPDVANGFWSLWMTQSLNAHDPISGGGPSFSDPVLASEHFIHRGTMNTLIGGQSGDRALGDFLQVRMGPQGEAQISYADSNNAHHADTPHAMFARQITGPSLLQGSGDVDISGLRPDNSVTDGTGDARYEAASQSSANAPNLDITGSSILKVPAGATPTSACPSTAGANGCYQVTMNVNNLSLAAPPAPDPDQDLVWLTQWLVPSTTDANGGKNLFVYGESFQGGAIQCWTGQNGEFSRFFALTYPGTTQITNAASCASTMGAGGSIVITVPLSSLVAVGSPIDSKLHEVIASTQTMARQANSDPTGLFNQIDGAQTYVFNPAQADLSLTKTDSPDPVAVGQDLTYTLTVHNDGPDPAENVVLTDTLPPGVTFSSSNPDAPACTKAGQTVTCDLGTVGVGASKDESVTITVTPTQAAIGTITNNASVSADTPDPHPADNTASEDTSVQELVDLAVTKKDAPDPTHVTRNITYHITVSNNGPGTTTATGVQLTDRLPSRVSFVSASPAQGTCAGSATVTCALGSLESGASATVDIVVKANKAGMVTNTASVTGNQSDPRLGNNTDSATTRVLGTADVRVTNADSPDPDHVGQDLTYTVTVSNDGPSAAEKTALRDQLPRSFDFVSASTTRGTCKPATSTNLVKCALGRLVKGASAVVTIVVRPTVRGTFAANATAHSLTFDPNKGNNHQKATTQVLA